MQEVWKTHEEYPQVQFSNLGNARKILSNGEYKSYKQTHSKKQVYLQINAKANAKLYVHREVCKLFNHNPHPRKYTSVLHNNHDRYDNRAENLRWGTQQQNMQDRLEAGHYSKGFGHNMAKLTNKDVFEIRWLHKHKIFNQTQISKFFGVKPCTISFITLGNTWRHLL